jgi:hypothetical protein
MGLFAAAIVIVIILSALFNSIIPFLLKAIAYVVGPKEWWSGALAIGSFRPRPWTVIYWFICTVFFTCVALFLMALSIGSRLEWLGMIGLLLLVGVPPLSIKLWVSSRREEQVKVQRLRDRLAQALSSQFAIGGFPKGVSGFCLYLRPFTSTGQLPVCTRESSITYKYPAVIGKERTEDKQDHADLETLLAMAMGSKTPLIALGMPGEQVGAGRIETTERNWKTEFQRLASKATAILVLPSIQPGTLWELHQILEDERLFLKTGFLIPPCLGSDELQKNAKKAIQQLAGVNRALQAGNVLDSQGIQSEGAVFSINREGIRFASPLLSYAHPPPFTFLIDLWFNRETIVLSGTRLRNRLKSALGLVKVIDSQTSPASHT